MFGKTTRELGTRITEHTSAMRRPDDTSPIYRHVKFAKHSLPDIKFLGIERILPHRRGIYSYCYIYIVSTLHLLQLYICNILCHICQLQYSLGGLLLLIVPNW